VILLKSIIRNIKVNNDKDYLVELLNHSKVTALTDDLLRWYKYNKQDVRDIIQVKIVEYVLRDYKYDDVNFDEDAFLEKMKFRVSYATKKEVAATQKSKEIPFSDEKLEKFKEVTIEDGILESVDLNNALNELSEREKKVIYLYFYENMKGREIAEILGVSQQRGNYIKLRAIEKLKNKML
jgi:RNA polymerase sigma factor (sigma-70 family)